MPFPQVQFPHTDTLSRMISRLLLQFRNSPVFLDFLEALSSELQLLQDAIEKVGWGRTVTRGLGEQLDAIGRIVGQPRIGLNYGNDWFTPDVNSVDHTFAWVPGGYMLGEYIPDDNVYRLMIESKVYRNFSRFGSVPEIQKSFKAAFGLDISFVITDPFQIDIIVPDRTPPYAKGVLIDFVTDSMVDRRNKMPFVPTIVVNNIYIVSDYFLTFHAGSVAGTPLRKWGITV